MTSIGGYVEERIGTGGFYVTATVRPDRKPEEVEAAIYEEIARLQQQPIADWELQKARNATRLGYLQSIRGAQTRATILGTLHGAVQRSGTDQHPACKDRGGDARRRAASGEEISAGDGPHRHLPPARAGRGGRAGSREDSSMKHRPRLNDIRCSHC